MQVLAVTAFIIGLLTGVLLILMVQDIEVQRQIFRRYVKQIDENGRIQSEVRWSEMKYGFFIRSGWFYRMPSTQGRPDLALYPELTEVRDKIAQNWRIIRWLVGLMVVCSSVFWLSFQRKQSPVGIDENKGSAELVRNELGLSNEMREARRGGP